MLYDWKALSSAIVLPPVERDPARHLAPTDVITSDQPAIIERARSLTAGLTDPFAITNALFVHVRDGVRYDVAPALDGRDAWRADATLARGHGFCEQKSVLLAALLRAAGVPCAIGFEHIRDHGLAQFADLLPEAVIVFHGMNFVWLDDAWRAIDATLDVQLCKRRGYRLVELRRGEDARLPATDLAGRPHVEVLEELGPFVDFPGAVSDAAAQLDVWDRLRERIARR